jgi:hypothetical protein
MLRTEAKNDFILGSGLSSSFYRIYIDKIGIVLISAESVPYLLSTMSDALIIMIPKLSFPIAFLS